MVCAGGETLVADPGTSTQFIKAFCGEEDDRVPDTRDVFSPGGIAPLELLDKVRELNAGGRFDEPAQKLIWAVTGRLVLDERTGGGDISSRTAALAGSTGLLLILIWMLLNNAAQVPTDQEMPVVAAAEGAPAPETGGGEEAESTGDRPAWSEIHRTSHDEKFDEKAGKWVTYDDWKAQKIRDMAEEGYSYDTERDAFIQDGLDYDERSEAYRKLLEPEEELTIKPEERDVTRPKLIPRLISYDESMEPLEARRRYLDELRNEALERVEDIDRQILEARESQDEWLEQQLLKRRTQAEQNIVKVEDAQNNLEDRLKNKDQKIQNYEKSYRNWSAWEVAKETVTFPWDMISSLFGTRDQFLEEAMVNAYQAKKRLQGDLEIQDELFNRFDEKMKKLKELRDGIAEAREAGDTEKEQRLRKEAEPVKDKMRKLSGEINSIHEANRHWQIRASIANLAAYKKAAEMTIEGQQVPHSGKMVSNIIDQYRRGNLPWQHRSRMTASGADDPMLGTRTPLMQAESELNAEHFRNASSGAHKVADWSRAHMEGAPESELKQRTIDCCEDYHAKLMQKQAPESIRREWAHDVRKYRDEPLMKEMTSRAKQRNWAVRENSGRLRPVTEDDFPTFTSTEGPGMDLDIGHNSNIIDRTTGKKIRYQDVQNLIDDSCNKLKFDPKKQQIIATGAGQPESYRMSRGTQPRHLFEQKNISQMDGYDVEQAYRVSEYKRARAPVEFGPADGLTEKCRTSIKDYRRFTEPLMETAHPGAKRPRVFSDEAMDIMDRVGQGKLPPGEGNRLFRQRTGMSLDEGCQKLNSLQEAVVKLDRPRPSAKDSYFHDRWTTRAERAEMAKDVFKPGDPDAKLLTGQTRTASAEQKARMLRNGETPDTFGRQVGPDKESKSAWSKYDDKHGIPKRGPEDEARLQQQKAFLDDPEIGEINSKIEKAWGDARAEKLQEIYKRAEAEMEWEGYSRDDPDFSYLVDKRVREHHLREQYDCQDQFQNKIDAMMDKGELGPSDYQRWYYRLKDRDM
jgi:hypothetical protein